MSIDKAIIEGCIKQDRKAEYALYKYCFALLMPICYRYQKSKDDAGDLLNKGFLKIILNLKQYKQDQPFEHWIKRIMVNAIIDEFRTNKPYKQTMSQTDMSELHQQYHPVDTNEAEGHLHAEELHRYISHLPQASKMVLNLFVFEGYSHKEIAKQLGITEGTSKWHLANARQLLKTMIIDATHQVKIQTA
ncbi:MAG: RNA polymerase sigma factor [Bacteroidetes bacterium]|nr:MAG: RNA polymerase sigma factor [Bacteroidota bacterium]